MDADYIALGVIIFILALLFIAVFVNLDDFLSKINQHPVVSIPIILLLFAILMMLLMSSVFLVVMLLMVRDRWQH